MSISTTIFNGTNEEKYALQVALDHHCTCHAENDTGQRMVCAGHAMLLGDQRAINGLLFDRRLRKRLIIEEFTTS